MVGLVVGLAALVWFVIRVIPKPSRAAYPCQRAAFPVASAFVLWIAGSLGGWALAERLRRRIPRARLAVMVLGLITAVGLVPWQNLRADTGPNAPVGTARGIHPGRVVWSRDPSATLWSGASDGTHWWDPNKTDQTRVDAMFSADLRALTGAATDSAAWDALFRSFNQRRGNGDIGYAASTRKTIAVKINQNPTNQKNDDYYAKNGVEGDEYAITANPHLILSLVKSLVAAGVKDTDIIISDPTSLNHQWGGNRTIGDNIYTYVNPLYPGVRFVDGVGKQGREVAAWPKADQIIYAQGGQALGTMIAQQFYDAGFIINMAILKSHGDGPTVCFKNHYGAISGQRHGPIYGNSTPQYYSNLIEPMGHQELGDKEMLFMIDALYGSSSPNVAPTKWKMAPFNGDWPASVFMSQDPVAIDSVGFDFLHAEFNLAAATANYLQEAAAPAGQKPSKTDYKPTAGSTAVLGSLGVFEHWNNVTAKQYTRNLDPVNGTGIELYTVTPGFAADAGVPDSGAGTGGKDAGAVIPGSDAGSGEGGGTPGGGGSAGGEPSSGNDKGCGCRVGGGGSSGAALFIVALAGFAVLERRRRRSLNT